MRIPTPLIVPLLCVAAATASHAGDAWSVTSPTVAPAPALDSAGEGRRAFLKLNCYGCHGMGAAGGMGPSIIGAERGDVSEAMKRGQEGGMPSYRAYATDTDITNIAAYLRTIGTPNEPLFNDWWIRIPPK